MSKAKQKPPYIRRLDRALQSSRSPYPPPAVSSGDYDIHWVLVEEDPTSSADRAFLRGRWTPGKSYRVRGRIDNLNSWRRDLILLLGDDYGRLHHVHMDHVRVVDEDEE